MMKDALQQKYDVVTQLAEAVLKDPSTSGTYEAHRLSEALEELYVLAEQVQEQEAELSEIHAALQAEHRKYVDLFEFCPDAYLVTDALGNIREANAGATRLLGKRRDALESKPITVFVSESERGNFRLDLNALLHSEQGRLEDREVQMVLDDKSSFAALVTAVRTPLPNGSVELHWLLRDVSQRSKAQKHMQPLATPILPVAKRVLLVPVVGELSSLRLADLERRLLARIAEHRAHTVIMDVTGVPTIESRSTESLVELTCSARLLGARLIISGVSTQTTLSLTSTTAHATLVSLEFAGDLREAIAQTMMAEEVTCHPLNGPDRPTNPEPERQIAFADSQAPHSSRRYALSGQAFED